MSRCVGLRFVAIAVLIGAVGLLYGCSDGGRYDKVDNSPNPTVQSAPASTDEAVAAQQAPSAEQSTAGEEATDEGRWNQGRSVSTTVGGLDLPGADPAPSAPAEQTPPPERQVADVGVGQKGRSLGEGILMTPIKAFFTSRELVAYRIQIPKAMQLFKAENGYAPRSHEEFMREIIQKNQIPLPELPPGCRYVYDPEREELMVEHPGAQ
ncbi:hypothetical protein JCM19992_13380 [Thermostilla marina]